MIHRYPTLDEIDRAPSHDEYVPQPSDLAFNEYVSLWDDIADEMYLTEKSVRIYSDYARKARFPR